MSMLRDRRLFPAHLRTKPQDRDPIPVIQLRCSYRDNRLSNRDAYFVRCNVNAVMVVEKCLLSCFSLDVLVNSLRRVT
jgi:hypothetical protein